MGLMNAIGLQPRNPAPSVTSQGTQTPIVQLQNAETQTERDLSEPSVSQLPLNVTPETPSTSRAAQAPPETSESSGVQDGEPPEASAESNPSAAGSGPVESAEFGSGEDALARIRRLIAEGGMTAVVQREQSTTMASMGGFGNNIIVSHRIHRGSQTGPGASRPPADLSSQPLLLAPPIWAPPPPTLSVTVDVDDVFDGGRTDDDSLPGPSSSSLLLSSPSPPSSSSSSSSSHSLLPGSEGGPNGYPGDPYSR